MAFERARCQIQPWSGGGGGTLCYNGGKAATDDTLATIKADGYFGIRNPTTGVVTATGLTEEQARKEGIGQVIDFVDQACHAIDGSVAGRAGCRAELHGRTGQEVVALYLDPSDGTVKMDTGASGAFTIT